MAKNRAQNTLKPSAVEPGSFIEEDRSMLNSVVRREHGRFQQASRSAFHIDPVQGFQSTRYHLDSPKDAHTPRIYFRLQHDILEMGVIELNPISRPHYVNVLV